VSSTSSLSLVSLQSKAEQDVMVTTLHADVNTSNSGTFEGLLAWHQVLVSAWYKKQIALTQKITKFYAMLPLA